MTSHNRPPHHPGSEVERSPDAECRAIDDRRAKVEKALHSPPQFIVDGVIHIEGYKHDGCCIFDYRDGSLLVIKKNSSLKKGHIEVIEVPIDELASVMREKRDRMLPPLKPRDVVLAIKSDGTLREGWLYKPDPSNPTGAIIFGIKDGSMADKKYPTKQMLQEEMAMAQAVAEYAKKDFDMLAPGSVEVSSGWHLASILDPATKKLKVVNKNSGKEILFDSVDHFLIAMHATQKRKNDDEKRKRLEKEDERRRERRDQEKAVPVPQHVGYTRMGLSSDAMYEDRMRITSVSQRIDGGIFMPSGLEAKQEAIVVDTNKDGKLKAYIEEITDSIATLHDTSLPLLGSVRKGRKPSAEEVLAHVAQKIQSDFPYSRKIAYDEHYAHQKYKPGQKYLLGNFMKKGGDSDMVCRHMGLLVQVILEKIRADSRHHFFPDDLTSNFMADMSDHDGHAYAIAALPSLGRKKYFYLDPASHQSMMEITMEFAKDHNKSRYLFSLLRIIFKSCSPSHSYFLRKLFAAAEKDPALRKVAHDALISSNDDQTLAFVRQFRKGMGLNEEL